MSYFVKVLIYKRIQQRIASHRETREFNREIVKSNLTLPESTYFSMANGIETALNQRWDDDEKRVYAELSKLQTPDDWKKLNVVFGSRKRDKSMLSPTVEGGLKDWFVDALSSSELNKVNQILNRISVTL